MLTYIPVDEFHELVPQTSELTYIPVDEFRELVPQTSELTYLLMSSVSYCSSSNF